MPQSTRLDPPPAARFFRVWLSLGLQSFGGGMATLALVRRAAVDGEKWITASEFSRFWSLVQLAPGINLLALTVLIGRKAAGTRGVLLALGGLLLPSVTVTILLTAGYAQVQQTPLVRAALSGILPAIVGLGLMTAWQIAVPLFGQSRREGRGSRKLSGLLLVGSGLAVGRFHWPVITVLGAAALTYAAWRWLNWKWAAR